MNKPVLNGIGRDVKKGERSMGDSNSAVSHGDPAHDMDLTESNCV